MKFESVLVFIHHDQDFYLYLVKAKSYQLFLIALIQIKVALIYLDFDAKIIVLWRFNLALIVRMLYVEALMVIH